MVQLKRTAPDAKRKEKIQEFTNPGKMAIYRLALEANPKKASGLALIDKVVFPLDAES
ncbi:hypothetical protein [Nostoc sp.]|uniref:hypothetical protein n=1 Tax=Nostoc sp. TaxID=1180 RepID=UPI002FFAF269